MNRRPKAEFWLIAGIAAALAPAAWSQQRPVRASCSERTPCYNLDRRDVITLSSAVRTEQFIQFVESAYEEAGRELTARQTDFVAVGANPSVEAQLNLCLREIGGAYPRRAFQQCVNQRLARAGASQPVVESVNEVFYPLFVVDASLARCRVVLDAADCRPVLDVKNRLSREFVENLRRIIATARPPRQVRQAPRPEPRQPRPQVTQIPAIRIRGRRPQPSPSPEVVAPAPEVVQPAVVPPETQPEPQAQPAPAPVQPEISQPEPQPQTPPPVTAPAETPSTPPSAETQPATASSVTEPAPSTAAAPASTEPQSQPAGDPGAVASTSSSSETGSTTGASGGTSSGAPGGVAGGAPGGTAGGVVGGTGRRPNPGQIMRRRSFPGSDEQQGESIQCSTERDIEDYLLSLSRDPNVMLVGQAERYACHVRTNHADLPAAVFLAEASLRVANISNRWPELVSYLLVNQHPPSLMNFYRWMEVALLALQSDSNTPGQAELAALLRFVQNMQNMEATAAAGIIQNRTRPDSALRAAFCPWVAQIQLVAPTATQGFPPSLVMCSGVRALPNPPGF